MVMITSQQRGALEALEWFFSEEEDERSSGRSAVLALAYLRQAFRLEVGTWIQVTDHVPLKTDSEVVLKLIARIVEDAGSSLEILGLREGQFQIRSHCKKLLNYIFTLRFYEPTGSSGPSGPPTRWEDSSYPVSRRVLDFVKENQGLSATQIAQSLKKSLDSVSSTLSKHVNEGRLRREEGQGLQEDSLYFLYAPVIGPSLWERIRTQDYKNGEGDDDDDD